MSSYDCQLDHHALIRLSAETPEAAKAEYFRRYGIAASVAPWTCVEAKEGSPAPVEPERWVKRRKELGTNGPMVKEAAAKAQAPVVTPVVTSQPAAESKAP